MIAPQNQICIYFQYCDGEIYAYASDGISDGPTLVCPPAKKAIERLADDFGLDPEDLFDSDSHSRLTTAIGVPLE